MFSGKWSPAASSTSPRRETMGSGPSPTARPSWMGTGRSELEAWQSSLVDEMRWSIACCLTANVLTALYPLRPHKFAHASSSLGDCLVRLKLRPFLVYLLSEGSSFLWNTFWICMTALWSALSCLKQLENCILVTRLVFFSVLKYRILVILISFAGYFFVSILLYLLKHLQRKCVTGMELSYKAQSS